MPMLCASLRGLLAHSAVRSRCNFRGGAGTGCTELALAWRRPRGGVQVLAGRVHARAVAGGAAGPGDGGGERGKHNWKVRLATPEDVSGILKLEEVLGRATWTRATLADELGLRCAAVHVAEEEDSPEWFGTNNIVGYTSGHSVRGEMHVLQLGVHPARRRLGLGRVLLDALLQNQPSVAVLEVRATDEAAIALYTRYGFEVAGRLNEHYPDGGAALVMHRADGGAAAAAGRADAAAFRRAQRIIRATQQRRAAQQRRQTLGWTPQDAAAPAATPAAAPATPAAPAVPA